MIREIKILLAKRETNGILSPGAKKLWKEQKYLCRVNRVLTRKRICAGKKAAVSFTKEILELCLKIYA